MKHFNKALLLIFALAVTVSIFMMTEISSSAATYSGSCGDNLIWNLDSSTGVLDISGTGKMNDYSYDSIYGTTAPWNAYISFIKTINMEDSVTSIGDYAFSNCTKLKSITIPNSIASIGIFSFYKCSFLKSVYITDLTAWCCVDFFQYIDNPIYYAENFYLNEELVTDLVIPDSIISINDYAFYNCDSLTSVTISDSVTSIGSYAFYNCKALICVTVPDSVTSIGDGAFEACTDLNTMKIGNSIASIGNSAFFNCPELTGVYITDLSVWCSVDFYNYYSNPLYYSDNLYVDGQLVTNLVIPEFVTNIGDYAFSGYNSLTSVTISDSVTSIGGYAFYNCGALTSVTISDSVTSIGSYAFYNCESLTSGSIPNSITYIGNGAFAHCDSLASVTIPDSVTSIGDYAFYDCDSLTSITIPESVTDISETAFNDSPVTIKCYENSPAHLYAAKNRISLQIIEKHTYTDYIYNNDATCTADGTKTAYCNCGCGLTDTVTAENTKVEHSFGDYTYNNDATCTSDATMTATCLYGCGTVDVKIVEGIKKEHTYTPQLLATPTCTASGKILYLCTCGYNYIEEVPVLEHTYGEWTVLLMPTLDTVGFEERKCSVCSTTEQRVIHVLEYVNPFTDVKESHWFYSSVEFVVKKGYMKGMSDTTFSPNSNITREQFVLILANIAGVDTNEFKTVSSGFADVPTGQWYSGAVTWAVREGYVSGMSADKFGRGQSIQRAALARMLYNYAGANGINVDGRADLSAFGDAKEFDKAGNAWMVEPIQWAVDAGIISGMEINGKLSVNPKGTATRAQAAVMLMKFDELLK